MFLIKGGRVKLSKLAESGHELILDYRKRVDFVGENILTDTKTYPCSAWCQKETLICGFSKQRFNALIRVPPPATAADTVKPVKWVSR